MASAHLAVAIIKVVSLGDSFIFLVLESVSEVKLSLDEQRSSMQTDRERHCGL